MVVVDTDVLLLAFAFHRDARQATNSEFLNRVQTAGPATTVYNPMELLGQLSFNLSPSRLDKWRSWLLEAYQLTLIWPRSVSEQGAEAFFRSELFDRPFAKIRGHRMGFMDALVLDLAERTPEVACLVTWNAGHFKGKTTLQVLTPEEFLAQAT